MEEALKDERFKHILSDPRFRKMPKRIQKVTLDKRMKMIFKDSSFKGKCELDKRGRPLNLTPAENLKKLYDMSSESSDDDDDEEENEEKNNHKIKKKEMKLKQDSTDKKSKNKAISKQHSNLSPRESTKILNSIPSESSDDDEEDKDGEYNCKDSKSKENKLKSKPDSNLQKTNNGVKDTQKKKGEKEEILSENDSEESSSEESDDSDSESDDSSGNQNDGFDHRWEELRKEAPDTNEITRRLAVCNMDWDRIRAVDLIVCFDSFKPSDGCINSVKIYPSEFGLKRMEEEKLKGPPELVEEKLDLDKEEPQDPKGSKYHREKLRQYQINRLKYFYAVVDCDSPETANVLYDQLNGMEYESSSVRFDLRFIPDDVTFDHEPTSAADKLPDPTEYKPRLFVTSALQQVKVDLTWDETDPKRREFFHKIFTDPDSVQNDVQDYLASASSESEVEECTASEELNESMKTKDRIAKYKELLLSIEEKEKKEEEDKNKYDMEITWEPSVKEKTEEQVKEKLKKSGLNPFEEMLQKKKEDKKLKKKEQKSVNKKAEESMSDSDDDFFESPSTSNGKNKDEKKLAELALMTESITEIESEEKSRKKNKKDKSKDLDSFVGDPNDPRFAAMYSSSLFNMIPTDQSTKKNKNKFMGNSDKKRKFNSKFHGSHKRSKH